MNEVRISQAAVITPVSSASSKGAADPKVKVDGKTLPEAVQKTTESEPVVRAESGEKLHTAVAQVNDYVQSIQRDLQFTVDSDLERTVIRVVDSDSGEVIRQIPDDIFLELARRLNDDGEMHLMDALG